MTREELAIESKPRILIIDDDVMGAQLLTALLELEGFQACQPEDWDNLLVDVEQQRPRLVLVDVRLRGKTGFDLLAQIRTHPDPEVAGTRVIMMSAEDFEIRARRNGADGFLAKPFDMPAMLKTIREMGGG